MGRVKLRQQISMQRQRRECVTALLKLTLLAIDFGI